VGVALFPAAAAAALLDEKMYCFFKERDGKKQIRGNIKTFVFFFFLHCCNNHVLLMYTLMWLQYLEQAFFFGSFTSSI